MKEILIADIFSLHI